MGVGVRQRPTSLTASGDIVVWEIAVPNSPSAALHGPPHTSWLLLLQCGRVRHLRLVPPLPGRESTLQEAPANELLGVPAHRVCDLFPDEGRQSYHARNSLRLRPHPRCPAGRRVVAGGDPAAARCRTPSSHPTLPRPVARLDDIRRLTRRIKDLGRTIPALPSHLGRALARICDIGTVTTMDPLVKVSATTSRPDPSRPGRYAHLGNSPDRRSLVLAHSAPYLSDHAEISHGGADVGDRAARPSTREWIYRSGTPRHSIRHPLTARSGRRLKPGQRAASALVVPVNPMAPCDEYADPVHGRPPHRGIAVFRCGSGKSLTHEVNQP